MPGVFFTNALMLAGMAALAIPVLIHLLLKRKKKRLRFSTIQFFQKQDEQSSRRRKLRNWLLLSLRLLLVALLVAAFARPYLTQQASAGAAGQKQRAVFLLDSSASMLATGMDGQRWGLAKARIQKVIAGLGQRDTAALVVCAARAEVLSAFAPPATVAHLLAELEPAYGTSNLGDGLRQAARLLSTGDRTARGTIYIVSDLQRSACRGVAGCPLSQEIEVKLLNVGDLISPNLAITEFEADARHGGKPEVTVASFSDENSPETKLNVSVDGKEIFSSSVQLKAGGATNIAVAFPPLKPGWHEAIASLGTKDSLQLDNSRYCSLWVPEPLRVFLVETRLSKRVFERESFFLAAALDPTKDSTNSVPGAFNLYEMAPEELISKLSGFGKQLPCEVAIVPGLRQIPTGSVATLTRFVQAGGGLLLFLNDEVSANQYNAELGELLPVQLAKLEAVPETGAPWRIGERDTNTCVFGVFRLPNSGNLNIPEFTKRFALSAQPGGRLLASFDDDAPLLVTRTFGRGRVALVNTSADTAWSDWPKHKTFVPWLHGLTKFLGQSSQQQDHGTNNFVAGDDFELETGVVGTRLPLKLAGPGGTETAVSCDSSGRLREPALTRPGIYTIRDNNGAELRRVAVNLPAQESDLTAFAPADFQQQLARVSEPPQQTLTANLFGSSSSEKEFWTALLAGALLLLLVEPIIANRTSA